jgi:hypothetical protein
MQQQQRRRHDDDDVGGIDLMPQVHSDYSSAESLTGGSLQRHLATDEISNQRGYDRHVAVDGQCGAARTLVSPLSVISVINCYCI